MRMRIRCPNRQSHQRKWTCSSTQQVWERSSSFKAAGLTSHRLFDIVWVLAGVWFKGLPIKSIDHVVASLVAEPTEDDPDFSPPMLNKKIARLVRHVPPLGLFVYGAMLSFPLIPPPVELTRLNDGLKKTWVHAGAAMAVGISDVE